MDIQFVATDAPLPEGAAHALVVFEGELLFGPAAQADERAGGALIRATKAARFTGAKGQVLDLLAPAGGGAVRLLLVGAGKAEAFDSVGAEHAAATAYNAVKSSGLECLRIEPPQRDRTHAEHAALGVRLAAYRFDRYRTKEAPERKPSVIRTQVVAANPDAALAGFAPLADLADAVAFARDLVSEPANVLYPAEFASRAKALETLGLEVEVLGEADMEKLGMGALLGVGQGSARESQLVVMQWKGGGKAKPVAFVGKGVCFDSGGISIKPAEGMEDMKWDMGGAAAVAGLMHLLAARKAKVNVVGVLGLVENMPSGDAQRPGDIVTTLSGQTVEVINTDAEGRLVLADAIWYTQDRFKPKAIIDLATLTGAIIVALGYDYAGLFCNDETLAANLLAAGEAEDERLWRMPMPSQYEKGLDSLAADMKNTGPRPGGSITAALFIQKFTNGVPWAHLDIASTAWKKPSAFPTIPDGATGFGVRLLNRLVADRYEG